jgi:hypothetical protein
MSMGLALGATILYYLWRPKTAANAKDNLITAVIFSSLYWVTQITATLFPAIRLMDPEFGHEIYQVYICPTLFTLIGIGYRLESNRIATITKASKA